MKKLILITVFLFSTLQATDLSNYINMANGNKIINKQVFTNGSSKLWYKSLQQQEVT